MKEAPAAEGLAAACGAKGAPPALLRAPLEYKFANLPVYRRCFVSRQVNHAQLEGLLWSAGQIKGFAIAISYDDPLRVLDEEHHFTVRYFQMQEHGRTFALEGLDTALC